MTNAATFKAGPIAPGEIVTLFGGGLISGPAVMAPIPSSSLGGLSLFVNAKPAPLYYTSADQINFQVPNETALGVARIILKRPGSADLVFACDVQARAPAILRSSTGEYAASFNQDGTRTIPPSAADPLAHPAQPEDIITFYAFGLGATSPAVAAGSPAPAAEPFARLTSNPSVYFGSSYEDATKGVVEFAGLAPGQIGVYQVNVRVPLGVRIGEHVPVTLTFDGYTSNTVEIAVGTQPQSLASHLLWFQDLKFGVMVVFGIYNQIGVEASWPIEWSTRTWENPSVKTIPEMIAYRQYYWGLNKTFNPVLFDPKSWAAQFRSDGFRYSIFTTKHCDGFTLFDTQLSDYRVTSPDVPFSKDPRANIVSQVFQALRDEHLGVGAYISKVDWHNDDYWKKDVFADTFGPNYDTAADPARLNRFSAFFRGQSMELAKNYGPIDIFWIDAGWTQGLGEAQLATDMRIYQPGLIFVNRYGMPLDYQTFEGTLPSDPVLNMPWEGEQALGSLWAYTPKDVYLSARQLVHTLVDVTARGGNYVVGIGPTGAGTIAPETAKPIGEVGLWLNVNGDAIFYTRPVAPYVQGAVSVTKKFNSTYVIYKFKDAALVPPASIDVPNWHPGENPSVQLLGSNEHVDWLKTATGITIQVPASALINPPAQHAVVFKFSD